MNLPNISISGIVQNDTGTDFETSSRIHKNTPSTPAKHSGPSTHRDRDHDLGAPAQKENGSHGLTIFRVNRGGSSNDSAEPNYVDETARPHQPIGKWRCCKCHKGHEIYNFVEGVHLASILNCVCTHRSCSNCALDGLIKKFQPMNEPEVVQLSEDGLRQVRFGVFCDGCGLSWRAQDVGAELSKKSTLDRISALPKRLAKRGAHPLEKLRHSRSMSNLPRFHLPNDPLRASRSTLNLRALSNEMEKGHGKQAEFATVKFTGIQCTCGLVTDASSLCFQVVDPPNDFHEAKLAKTVAERKVAGFSSTPEDQAKGHGTPMLRLKGGPHVNPLMSNPVTDDA